jgi:hypothetical protein
LFESVSVSPPTKENPMRLPATISGRLRNAVLGLSAAAFLAALPSFATETEHTRYKVFRADAPITVDGSWEDWDLTGSMLICSDVENYRDQFASWQCAAYDDENLYLLSRWIDTTPLNNPGLFGSDMGFAGDCLQVRIILDATGQAARNGTATERCTHIDAWRGRDGRDGISCTYGRNFDQGGVRNLLDLGARQAFRVNEDGSGYTQEISIPWTLLAPEGYTPKAGDTLIMTYEPNFGTSSKLRITTKDLFRPGVTPDRVFAFSASPLWGPVKLGGESDRKPLPVRLSDGRTFPVSLDGQGLPEVNWNGLYVENKLEGFKPITLDMPEDGFVSLVIRNADGFVVRNLLNAEFLAKGEHEVLWDGLANQNAKIYGDPVATGEYTWEAIYRKALDLKLVGWAANAGSAPYDCPGGNWGGDQGNPNTVDCDAERIYLGWTGSEAGQAVVCVNYDGRVQWRHKRGGFGGASIVAVDGPHLLVYDLGQGNVVYRLDAARGEYANFDGSDTAVLGMSPLMAPYIPDGADVPHYGMAGSGMAVADGKLFFSFGPVNGGWRQPQPSGDVVMVIDAASGRQIGEIPVANPGSLCLGADGRLYLVAGDSAYVVDTGTYALDKVVEGLGPGARSIAADRDGNVYVGFDAPVNQVRVYTGGKLARTIGREGGRALTGPWQQDGLLAIGGMKIDARGRLWVSEFDDKPRRFSQWDAATGGFLREFFGPTHYGAGGGAICPTDPYTMVGLNCEWKLDPETGLAECVAVVSRGRWHNARFGQAPDGRVFVAVGGGWAPHFPVEIHERLGPGDWRLRTRLTCLPREPHMASEDGVVHEGGASGLRVWADANDDQQEQPGEVQERFLPDMGGWIDGWYMPMNQALTFCGGNYVIAVTGWSPCGAPEYDVGRLRRLPDSAIREAEGRGGMGAQKNIVSEDGRFVIYNAHYGLESSDIPCFEIATGRKVAAYPSNYVGVHGGHSAPPAKQGMIRAAYDYVGTIKMPEPLGNVFVIGTDKGEWHLVNDAGYYIGKLFEGDAMKIKWPDEAVPGANMNNIPPGMGAEDFGGSLVRTTDGRVFVQAGKTAFINMQLAGLDTYKRLASGTLSMDEDDQTLANTFKVKYLSVAESARVASVPRKDVVFSLNPDNDFGPAFAEFGPPNARIRTWIACGAGRLYLAWRVADATPWINGATSVKNMYAMGDTVDFQLGTDPGADVKRGEAAAGDFRLSIGSHGGANVAVIYRRVSDEKAPETFFSGVWRDGYTMDLVKPLDDVAVQVETYDGGYVVEASVPLATLGIEPAEGLRLKGDIGATFGDPAGKDTVLRVYWANQATGIVADEVAELMMQPALWGAFEF